MKADIGFKFLGKYLVFKYDGVEKMGRLVQLRIDSHDIMLVGFDENGYLEEYDITKVQVTKIKEGQKILEKEIIKYVNRDINSFKFDLEEYYRDTIDEITVKINSDLLKSKIFELLNKKDDLASAKLVYSEIAGIGLSDDEVDILCGVISYKQRDLNKAYEIFSRRWLMDKANPDKCRDFLLIADEFDNDVLCFYLLKEFFITNGKYIGDRYYSNLWWKCLYYCVKYNNFEPLVAIETNEWNVRILLDSFIFVFHMYNMEHLAIGLTNQFVEGNNTVLQRNNEDLRSITEAEEELNLLKNYLPEDAEGYYRRFELCLDKIISSYEKNDDNPDEKSGYVYEYVKSRNYGFIIGFDFKKYFFHWDFVPHYLRTRILDSIYSGQDVDLEERIFVQFKEEQYNKRLQAIDII